MKKTYNLYAVINRKETTFKHKFSSRLAALRYAVNLYGPFDCLKSENNKGDHLVEYVFNDNNRFFIQRVVKTKR